MRPPSTLALPVAILLVILAFVLGLLGERWWNGAARDAALERYEQATQGYRSR
jgi:uncharacterized membrane protein YqiK